MKLWRDVHLSIIREGKFDLTARQLTVLLTVYLDKPPHTVCGLAKTLITHALDTMGKAGLVSRKRDMADRRNVIIQRMVEGSLFIEQLGDRTVELSARAKPLRDGRFRTMIGAKRLAHIPICATRFRLILSQKRSVRMDQVLMDIP